MKLNKIKKGDIVGRKSYGKDIIFIVERIIQNKNDKIAILKGLVERIEADSDVDDLEIIEKRKINRSLENLNEKVEMEIDDNLNLNEKVEMETKFEAESADQKAYRISDFSFRETGENRYARRKRVVSEKGYFIEWNNDFKDARKKIYGKKVREWKWDMDGN